MPPYSKLKAFMVEKYRAIADNPEASVDQKLRALGHLEGLQVKRKPRPKRVTSGSFKKGHDPKTRAPKAIDSRLLGAVPTIGSSLPDPALLGTVKASPDSLENVGPATGSAALEDEKGVV